MVPQRLKKNSLIVRRSIYVVADIAEGEVFTTENLRIVRPGNGAPPHLLEKVLDKSARRDCAEGEPLSL